MKLFFRRTRNTLFILTAIIIASCSETSKKTDETQPSISCISAFTSGVISNKSSIKVRLRESVGNVKINEPIKENVFDFSPNIEGTTFWSDNQTIVFLPDELIPSGKLFNAKVNLSKIIEVTEEMKTFKFVFQTIKQGFDISIKGFESYDNRKLEWQKILGVVTTADYVKDEKLESLLEAFQEDASLSVRWKHLEYNNKHEFVIDSVIRKEEMQKVILKWDGDNIDVDDEGVKEVEIPGLKDFKITNIKVYQHPSQGVSVQFSDPLDNFQNLKGLIQLEKSSNPRFIIRGNEIIIYPKKRISGTRTLLINQGITNVMGYPLQEDFKHSVMFENIKPAIELIGKGTILPNSDGLIFPFKAVNLKAVNVKIVKIFEDNIMQFLQVNQISDTYQIKRVGRVIYKGEMVLKSEKTIDYSKWNNFSIDLSDLINTEPGAIYRIILNFTKNQSLYPCEDEDVENLEKAKTNNWDKISENDRGFSNWKGFEEYDYYRNYQYNERNNPCKASYYLRNNRLVAKNIFASNLGIIAKGGNGKSMFFAVTNLLTTDQISGVELKVYNYQQQEILSTTTDSKGIARVDIKARPYLLVAKYKDQYGYLRLDDGSALSLSMFNVSGKKTKKGIKGFIYGERGVWRPGDSIYLSFIIEDKLEVMPKNHPIVMELYNPKGQLFLRKVRAKNVNGVYDFRTATERNAPTGNWLVKIKVGGSIFTKTLKIETIKPNRLKINLDFNSNLLYSYEKKKSGKLSVKWLHGAIAKNLKADISLTMSQIKTVFEDYPGFVFDDPARSFSSDEKKIFKGVVDENGEANINCEFNVGSSSPGMLKANFNIRAFEKGGDFSVDRYSIPFSPYKEYIGIKIPKGKGWNGALYSNEKNIIPIVSVNEKGRPVSCDNIEVEVYEVRWRWWWERHDNDNLSRYISGNNRRIIERGKVKTINGKGIYEMKLERNYWGRVFLRFINKKSGHSTGSIVYLNYSGWRKDNGSKNPGGATMLAFKMDKDKYSVGENVQLTIPSGKDGKALVSIESGTDVIDAFWVETKEQSTTALFEVTEKMAPNAFVHITIIQPHNQTENNLPIRLYGIQPIMVEDPKTHLYPIIDMPDELSPEKKVTIKISEKSGTPMTYTIAVVEDGLLDLTRFKTPQPWDCFYTREALGIKTWDMYDDVIGSFTGEMAGLLALGGDEFLNNDGNKANRFKPVVMFMGPFELDSKDENKHVFTMPNYIGSVRTMVVARHKAAYGSSEKTTPVKKPLMVLATLPRVTGPEEKIKLPVTVFAMDKKVKKVKVKIDASNIFNILGENEKMLSFSEEGEQIAEFELSVKPKLGIGKVKVIATSGNEKAEYEIEIDVRVPNPTVTKVIDTILEPGQSWATEYKTIGMAGTNTGILEVSKMAPLNLSERLNYLIRYPHGCVEQTTSSVFPQLFLSSLIELEDEDEEKIENNIKKGIERLRRFQLPEGGLSYWPGNGNKVSEWGTNYAGHFMIEAKALGYDMPIGFIKSWIEFQKKMATNWNSTNGNSLSSHHNNNHLVQAYRLFTLSLAGSPELGAMNRMRRLNDLSLQSKWRLAVAYYLAGKPEVASEMISKLAYEIKPYKELSYTYGSHRRDQAMILEALSIMKKKSVALPLLKELGKAMGSGHWYSTQTTSYALMAFAKYYGVNKSEEPLSFDYTINGKTDNVEIQSPISQTDIKIKGIESGIVKVVNNGKSLVFAKITLEGIPIVGDNKSYDKKMEMKIRYTDMKGKEIDPTILEQGTDFIAEVKITHNGILSEYKEMALTQIFASGWEIRNMRMENYESVFKGSVPTYEDIRDDRVYTYFDIKKATTKTFRVLLNATYLGKFYLPSVYCEAMYDNEISSKKGGKWVEVIMPGIK